MYEIRIYKQAQREIKKISRRHQEALLAAFGAIREDPLSGKPLTRELTGRFSYRVGQYRIIYRVNQKDNVVQIVSAGHRSRVYK